MPEEDQVIRPFPTYAEADAVLDAEFDGGPGDATPDPDFDVEILGEEPAQFANAEFIEQLLGGTDTLPEPEPITVRRYWLDEASFRAIALLEQGGEVGILFSDGENQIMLFDSVSQSPDQLYLLQAIIQDAFGVLDTPDEGIDSE